MTKYIAVLLATFFCSSGHAQISGVELSDTVIEKDITFAGQVLQVSGTKEGNEEIAILVSGPVKSYQVVLKEKKFGIWVNSKNYTIPAISSYHHVATSKPISNLTDNGTLKFLDLKPNGSECVAKANTSQGNAIKYCDAFYNKKIRTQLYEKKTGDIYVSGRFFSSSFRLPETSPTGLYNVKIFSFNPKGDMVDTLHTYFFIKDGEIYHTLSKFARDYPVTHSVLAIMFALLFGTVIGMIFNGGKKKDGIS